MNGPLGLLNQSVVNLLNPAGMFGLPSRDALMISVELAIASAVSPPLAAKGELADSRVNCWASLAPDNASAVPPAVAATPSAATAYSQGIDYVIRT